MLYISNSFCGFVENASSEGPATCYWRPDLQNST